MTKRRLLAALAALGDITTEQRNAVVCALVGHSLIQSACFGYFNCARCGEQAGDSLGGAYTADKVVVVGHDCSTCRANYKKLTWRDKLFAADPFKSA